MSTCEINVVVAPDAAGKPAVSVAVSGINTPPQDLHLLFTSCEHDGEDACKPVRIEPATIETTATGLLLGINAAAAQAARLKPGSAFILEIPSLDVRTVAEWPVVEAPAAPVAAPEPQAADAAEAVDPIAAVLAKSLRAIEAPLGADGPQTDEVRAAFAGRRGGATGSAEPVAVTLEQAQQRLSTIVSKIMTYDSEAQATAPPAIPPPIAATFRSIGERLSASEIAAALAAVSPEGEEPRPDPRAAEAARLAAANDDAGADDPHDEDDATSGAASRATGALPQSRRRDYPIAKYKPAPAPVDKLGRQMSIAALVLAGFAAVAALIGLTWTISSARTTAVAAAAPRLAGSPAEGGPASGVGPGGSFADAFTIAGVSPKGRARKGVDLDTGLGLADQYLSAGSEADRIEGEYWLKHALSLALGDERIRWALTQLGSGYAAGTTGAPDYAKARLLWEIAGQLGDPVALCFLGTIYERGLGVPVDKGQALTWFARAKQAGGCPGGEAALSRAGQ